MGGEINWQALEHVNAIVGVDDPELLVRALVTMRDHLRAQNA